MTDRILDKDLEDKIMAMVDKHVKESRTQLMNAGNMVHDKQKVFEDSVSQKPYAWVAGAFVAGLVLGKILHKSNGDM